MARLRVAALCLQQLLLADQHVDDGARSDFVTGLGGIEGTLCGNHSLTGGLHLACAGNHRTVAVARAALERARLFVA
jgi:hypothetical protein